jgi:hypothetical protein
MNTRSDERRSWARSLCILPLVLALAGCGGSAETTPDPDPGSTPESTPDPAPVATLPDAFRGQWEAILTYVPPFYSGPYGSIPEGDGSIGIAFYFGPDGSYRHDWNLARAYFGGNCFQTAQWQEVGTLGGTGPDFTFTPGRASYLSSDSCGQFKYLDPAPVIPANHTLTIDHDATGWPLLRIGFPTGELVLEKCRRCP